MFRLDDDKTVKVPAREFRLHLPNAVLVYGFLDHATILRRRFFATLVAQPDRRRLACEAPPIKVKSVHLARPYPDVIVKLCDAGGHSRGRMRLAATPIRVGRCAHSLMTSRDGPTVEGDGDGAEDNDEDTGRRLHANGNRHARRLPLATRRVGTQSRGQGRTRVSLF